MHRSTGWSVLAAVWGMVFAVAGVASAQSASLHIDGDWFRQSLERDIAAPFTDFVLVKNDIYHSGQLAAKAGFFRSEMLDSWVVPQIPSGTELIKRSLQMNQGRYIYSASVGYRWLNGESGFANTERYRQAASLASDFIIANGKDNVNGGWFWGFRADGQKDATGGPNIANSSWDHYDTKKTIGHAAILTGLSRTYEITNNSNYWNAAKDVWNTIDTQLRDSYGWPMNGVSRDFSTLEVTPTKPTTERNHIPDRPDMNVMMHTFESLQAMYIAAPSAEKAQVGQKLRDWGNFLMNNCYMDMPGQPNKGIFPEKFMSVRQDQNHNWVASPTWQPILSDYSYTYEKYNSTTKLWEPKTKLMDGDDYTNLGHSIETTYFVSRAVELLEANGHISAAEKNDWLTKAAKVIRFCLDSGYKPYTYTDKNGVSRTLNGLIETASFAGVADNKAPGTWPQLEMMRAVAHWAVVRGGAAGGGLSEDDLWEYFDETLAMATGQSPFLNITGQWAHFMDPQDGGWNGFLAEGYTSTSGKAGDWGGPYHDAMFYDEMLRLLSLASVPEPGAVGIVAFASLFLLRRRGA